MHKIKFLKEIHNCKIEINIKQKTITVFRTNQQQELSEDNIVCRGQPNCNSNCQLVCVKSKIKVFVYRWPRQQRQQCRWRRQLWQDLEFSDHLCYSILNIVAALRGMHVSTAKHSYVRLPRECDYRTDRQTDRQMDRQTDVGQSDPYVPLCFAGDTQKNDKCKQQNHEHAEIQI